MAGRAPNLNGRKALLGARSINFETIGRDTVLAPPPALGPDGRYCWQHATASLIKAGILARGDLPMLEAMCHEWERYARLQAVIAHRNRESADGFGGELSTTPNGHVQMSAERISANQALKQVRHIAQEFGLTPVARVRTAGTAQGDLFDGLEPPDEAPKPDQEPPNPTDPFNSVVPFRGGG